MARTRKNCNDALPTGNQEVVRVNKRYRGSIYEVQDVSGNISYARTADGIPLFRRLVEGEYVVLQPYPERDLLKGELRSILYPGDIKYMKKKGTWPAAFEVDDAVPEGSESSSEEFQTSSEEDEHLSDESDFPF
ncbi:hypothetical protein MTO96_031983 [Rhipicephalus appendiculatus]